VTDDSHREGSQRDDFDRDDFQRYLRAKRTVDDRSLDRRVVGRLEDELRAASDENDGPIRVLEVGAGVGTMVERLVEWDVLPAGGVRYTAIDVDASNVRAMRRRLPDWAADRGMDVTGAKADAASLTLSGGDRTIVVEPVVADATDFVETAHGDAAAATGEWDLLIGAALLDVLGLEALPTLLSSLDPGGLWYFPITFDGATRFVPSLPADRLVERYYHEHMDRKPGGNSRAGQGALERLRDRSTAEVLEVAGSDWIVRPIDGEYPADEAFFLRFVLATIEDALGELDRGDDLADDVLAGWLEERRRRVDDADLVYLTHQLDLLGRVTG
jgi:hypothetical protein